MPAPHVTRLRSPLRCLAARVQEVKNLFHRFLTSFTLQGEALADFLSSQLLVVRALSASSGPLPKRNLEAPRNDFAKNF